MCALRKYVREREKLFVFQVASRSCRWDRDPFCLWVVMFLYVMVVGWLVGSPDSWSNAERLLENIALKIPLIYSRDAATAAATLENMSSSRNKMLSNKDISTSVASTPLFLVCTGRSPSE